MRLLSRFFALSSLVAIPALGGVQYEFEHTTISDSHLRGPVRLVGRAVVEGDRSRVDYLDGSTRGAGSYVITNLGAREIVIVDPKQKRFMRRSTGMGARFVEAMKVRVSNLKSEVRELGPGPAIAGHPTRHYRMTATYDISVDVASLNLRQHVTMTVEKWTTDAFSSVAPEFLAGASLATGNSEIDELLQAEASKISGFPLRQFVTVSTVLEGQPVVNLPGGKLLPTRNQRTEIQVMKIGRMTVAEGFFEVPSGYREVTSAPGGTESSLHMLTMAEEVQ